MDKFEQILDDAIKHDFGVGVLCNGAPQADALKRLLYKKRAEARERGDTRYDRLSLSFSPHAGDVLFVHKKKEDPDE